MLPIIFSLAAFAVPTLAASIPRAQVGIDPGQVTCSGDIQNIDQSDLTDMVRTSPITKKKIVRLTA
jgi:hypothetical protein